MGLKIGTRSVLFGVHCVLIHPWFVALAWTRLYGFPWHPLLWLSFFVHDLGYIGKPNLDGPEGETHVELGAKIMSVFGPRWRDFTLYHSRFYARQHNKVISRLCVADKYAIVLTPSWLYLTLAALGGELSEFMSMGADKDSKYQGLHAAQTPEAWLSSVQDYLRTWVSQHA